MAKKFRELVQETLSEGEQAEAHAASRVMLLELSLRQIREKVSELSQEEVARLLEVTQPYISKLERQQDMLVSKPGNEVLVHCEGDRLIIEPITKKRGLLAILSELQPMNVECPDVDEGTLVLDDIDLDPK